MPETIRAAIVQAKPVYYNLAGTLEKAQDLLSDAASKGAQLVTFGETWFPGYPSWLDYCPEMGLWDHEPTKEVYARLVENSITVPGPEIEQLAQQAQQLSVVLVLGINEKVANGPGNGTLYNTLITIDANGDVVNRHRKLMPTHTERLVWGIGDTDGLEAVDTAVGRVSGLVCWEHWMPLARQVVHDSNEQIHIAVWPTVHEMHQVASRHYAFEGRTFVLAAGGILAAAELPSELKLAPEITPQTLVQKGGSAIIAPDGSYLAGPVYDEEVILTADLDLRHITKERMALDVTGHYSRRELFTFGVQS